MRPARYLSVLALSAAVTFAAAWGWIAAMPIAFLEPEYASWRAKQVMLDRCDLGEVVILGDSRAAADILPVRLPVRAANLAIGGGEAIEAVALLTRVVACPVPPRLVILSFDPGHFTHADLFWERSVRYGLLSATEIAGLRAASAATGDASVYEARHTDGVPSVLRDQLNLMRFPPYYFSGLAHGGGFMRWAGNERRLADTLASRGHYYFGIATESHAVALDGHLDGFRPLPILDHYFDRLLALLNEHGIEALFIAMPINEATWTQVDPEMHRRFANYLAAYARHYPLFHVADDLMPHWPDRFFGDQFCHLNPEGAERFSAQLAQRLQDAPPSTQKEAQKGWLRDTGAAASAKVVPISKRGS